MPHPPSPFVLPSGLRSSDQTARSFYAFHRLARVGLCGWLVLAGLYGVPRYAEAQGGPAGVRVAPIERAAVAAPRVFVGSVQPARRSIIGSAVAGRVEAVHYDEGDYISMPSNSAQNGQVGSGQVGSGQNGQAAGEGDSESRGAAIVQLRTKTVGLELAVAQAELALRQSELEELEAGAREEEKLKAAAEREAAEAMARYAETRFKRTENLFQQNVSATEEELEEALAQKVAAAQTLAAARAEYDLVMKGPRAEKIDQARAQLKQSQEKVEQLLDIRSKYTIRSPFAGYLVSKQTEVGEWVNQGDPVAEVIEMDPAEIEVAVPESYISFLKPGTQVTLQFDAIRQEVFTGRIYRIVPQADLRSRSFPVKIRLDNPRNDSQGGASTSHLLKAGMIAKAILAVGREEDALMVPKDALVLNGNTTSVMRVSQDPKTKQAVAEAVAVEVGIASESAIQVIDRSGSLRAGDQVVVVGNERLRPGQPVNILPSGPATTSTRPSLAN